MKNQYQEEISYVREKIKIYEKRGYQMIFLCATGFATILSLSKTIPEIFIPIILFILLMITENIFYTSVRGQVFLNEYLINLYFRLKLDINFEHTFKEVFYLPKYSDEKPSFLKKLSRKIFKWFFHPFIILPIFYLFYSAYIVMIKFNDLMKQDYISFVIVCIIILTIFLGYIYVLVRNIRLRNKTLTDKLNLEFKNQLDKYFEKNQIINV